MSGPLPRGVRGADLVAYARLARARPEPRPIARRELLDELARVHLLEQAALLREAVELGLRWGRGRSLRTHEGRSPAAVRAWRARVDEELACARADGQAVARELGACRRESPRHWTPQRTLRCARAALGLSDRASARLSLACASARAGDAATALAELDRLERALARASGPRPVLDVPAERLSRIDARCRASALEQTGDLEGAAECLERLGSDPYGAALRFALALALEDERRAGRARTELRLAPPARADRSCRRATRAALADLAECLPRWGRGGRAGDGPCAAIVFEALCEPPGSAAAAVALAWIRCGAPVVAPPQRRVHARARRGGRR